jgi:hypothetical protein
MLDDSARGIAVAHCADIAELGEHTQLAQDPCIAFDR